MNNITILGGGAAGWMTAAYLSKNKPDLNITVIESPNIKTQSVGESTTPHIMTYFKSIGVKDESEWMPKCDATYKIGILYDDWDFVNSRGWHSFEVENGKYEYWNKLRKDNNLDRQDYWASTMYNSHIALRDSSKFLAGKDGNIKFPYKTKSEHGWPQIYAYHVNADKFGAFVKEIALSNGVINIIDEIVNVPTNDNGVEYLEGESGAKYTSDLFIDCTGFKRLLIDKVAEEKFSSFEPYLTHDKAMVIRYDYTDKESEMKPRTKAKCLSSGWYWEIPLYDKISVGYVYTSKFISDEEAEDEIRNEIGYEKAKNAEAYIVDIESGYYPKPWSKNVLAIGLSAGFIEPLESTLLYSVIWAGRTVKSVMDGKLTIDQYNGKVNGGMADFVDFISIGYYMSHRNDSEFWRSRDGKTISKKMTDWLEKEGETPKDTQLFLESSWLSKQIMFNRFPDTHKSIGDEEKIQKEMDKVKSFDFKELLSQKEYLDRFIYKV